jgi:hypothetical protein
LKIPIIGKIAIELFSIVDLATVQKGGDKPIVSTMERYSEFCRTTCRCKCGSRPDEKAPQNADGK